MKPPEKATQLLCREDHVTRAQGAPRFWGRVLAHLPQQISGAMTRNGPGSRFYLVRGSLALHGAAASDQNWNEEETMYPNRPFSFGFCLVFAFGRPSPLAASHPPFH